jgi:hypothetical protein
MPSLSNSLRAWGTPGFRETLAREIECLGAAALPLQQGLSAGSYAVEDGARAMILAVSEGPTAIQVRAGLFYSSIIAGCSCADDPGPVEEQREYCEVQIDIAKTTGEATVTLLTDDHNAAG